jgi:hypothetical protein
MKWTKPEIVPTPALQFDGLPNQLDQIGRLKHARLGVVAAS